MRLVADDSRTHRRARGLTPALAAAALALCLYAAPVVAADPPAAPVAASSSAYSGAAASPLGLPLFRFLDPSRLTWNQSLTFGYSSGGFVRGGSGLYTSSFGYRIADPLRLRLDVGAQLGSNFSGMDRNPSVFLQGMALDWRPFKNSVIRFVYQDVRSPLQWRGVPGYGYYGLEPLGLDPLDAPSRN